MGIQSVESFLLLCFHWMELGERVDPWKLDLKIGRGDGTRWGWGIQSDESITFLL